MLWTSKLLYNISIEINKHIGEYNHNNNIGKHGLNNENYKLKSTYLVPIDRYL